MCNNVTLTLTTTRRESEHQALTLGAGLLRSNQSSPEHSKKRSESSEAAGVPENPTSKRCQIIQNWSDEDEEENPTTDLLTPHQRKGAEQPA
jgi:hypothetical protein